MDTGVWVPAPDRVESRPFAGMTAWAGMRVTCGDTGWRWAFFTHPLKFRGLQDGLTKARAQP